MPDGVTLGPFPSASIGGWTAITRAVIGWMSILAVMVVAFSRSRLHAWTGLISMSS